MLEMARKSSIGCNLTEQGNECSAQPLPDFSKTITALSYFRTRDWSIGKREREVPD